MSDLKQQLTHLTGGRLNNEELNDLTGFVERLRTDARRQGYLIIASLCGVRNEAEQLIDRMAGALTKSLDDK